MSRAGEYRATALALGLLGAAVVGFYWKAFTLQGTFFLQDVMVQNYPFRDFFARALADGELPLWCPFINFGFPLFAEGQAGPLYPFNLVAALLLPTFAALNYNLIAHVWLAAAGTYWFLRLHGCRQAAAIAGGLIFGCSGFFVVRAMSFNYVDACSWMPVLFALVEAAVQRRRSMYLVLGAGVVGLQFLAGHPQATTYAIGAALLYGAYRGLVARCGRLYWGTLVGMPILGAALAAVQLVPTMELVSLSGRGKGVGLDAFLSMSLPPERLITFLLPNFFGNSSTGSYWGQENGFFIQLCGYVGVLPLLLSAIAWRARTDSHAGFFVALAGLALLLVLGRYTALFQFLYQVPGLDYFRIPTRFLQWLAFALAVLSGFGLDALLRGIDRQQRAFVLWIGTLFAAVGGVLGWAKWRQLDVGAIHFPYELGVDVMQYGHDLEQDLVVLGAVLALMLAILLYRTLGGESAIREKVTAAAVVAVVGAELFVFGGGFNAVIDPDVYRRLPATAAAIHADVTEARFGEGPPPRIISLVSERNAPFDWHAGWSLDASSYQAYPATLRFYTGSQYGLANVMPGWSPLHLRRQWEFARLYPGVLDLGAVGYAVSHRPLPHGDFEILFTDSNGIKVYRNRDVLPQAYMVGEAVAIDGDRRRIEYMRSARFEPRRQAVTEHPIELGGDGGPAVGATITQYESERVEVELGGQGGLLVLCDTDYPGWRAQVDGETAEIVRVNHLFRGVRVEEGDRRVVFQYQPASFTTGVWVSAGAGILFLVALAASRHRLLATGASGAVSAHRFKAWTMQVVLIVLIHALVTQWPEWARGLVRSQLAGFFGG